MQAFIRRIEQDLQRSFWRAREAGEETRRPGLVSEVFHDAIELRPPTPLVTDRYLQPKYQYQAPGVCDKSNHITHNASAATGLAEEEDPESASEEPALRRRQDRRTKAQTEL
jgi:hypothetical protein